MSVKTPDNTAQVESRIKTDVQREATDSNPYIRVHWLRSLIAGFARRIFDFYQDLNRTEQRLFPDTADDETAPIWGAIYVGSVNQATKANGHAIASGLPGSAIAINTLVTANGKEYITKSNSTIADHVLNVLSITQSGNIASVITQSDHHLSSFIPVTISGADQPEYNVTDAQITVTGSDGFDYEITGSPLSPATGSIVISFTSSTVDIESIEFGSDVNLDLDTAVSLQSPIVNVGDNLYVDFGNVEGGSDGETTSQYKSRYLDKIRNPVAHFNVSDIVAIAKKITGVTRVFVESSGTLIGTLAISTMTRSGNIAKVITTSDHGFDDGQIVTVTGATQTEYNVTNARIIVEDNMTFYYLVLGSPVTPATGILVVSASIPLGQVRTFFMRDNDPNPIPALSEVQTVKEIIDTIMPANTPTENNIVKAPDPVVVDYTFTELVPNTATMRSSVSANLEQFHDEQTTVGVSVDEDAYRAAIKNTIDTVTGELLSSFELSGPVGDISINSGQIATKGSVNF